MVAMAVPVKADHGAERAGHAATWSTRARAIPAGALAWSTYVRAVMSFCAFTWL